MRIEPSQRLGFSEFAQHACNMAKEKQVSIEFDWSGIEYVIPPGTPFKVFLKRATELQQERIRERETSLEGIKYKEEQRKKEEERRQRYLNLMCEFPDLENLEETLDWCYEIFKTGNYSRNSRILNVFIAYSLIPGMELVFDDSSKESYAKILIGTFLTGVENGAIPEAFHRFYKDFKTTFAK
jgi:hypothetical protein